MLSQEQENHRLRNLEDDGWVMLPVGTRERVVSENAVYVVHLSSFLILQRKEQNEPLVIKFVLVGHHESSVNR